VLLLAISKSSTPWPLGISVAVGIQVHGLHRRLDDDAGMGADCPEVGPSGVDRGHIDGLRDGRQVHSVRRKRGGLVRHIFRYEMIHAQISNMLRSVPHSVVRY
jgi:hypothetical protein